MKKKIVTGVLAAMVFLGLYIALGSVIPRAEFGYGWGLLHGIEYNVWHSMPEAVFERRVYLFATPFKCAQRESWQIGSINGQCTMHWLLGQQHTIAHPLPARFYSPWAPLEDE